MREDTEGQRLLGAENEESVSVGRAGVGSPPLPALAPEPQSQSAWGLLTSLQRSGSELIRTNSHLSTLSVGSGGSRRRRLTRQQSADSMGSAGALSAMEDGRSRVGVVPSADSDRDSVSSSGDTNGAEATGELGMEDLRTLIEKLQNTLPFAFLLVSYLAFKFTAYIVYFLVLQFALIAADSRLRVKVTERVITGSPLYLGTLAISCVGFVLASGIAAPHLVGFRVWQRLAGLPLLKEERDFFSSCGLVSMVWFIAIVDGWVCLLTIALKAIVVSMPLLKMTFQKRKACATLEVAMLLYRSLLPIPIWVFFYYRDVISPFEFLFAWLYAVLKLSSIMRRMRVLSQGLTVQCQGGLEVGRHATQAEVDASGSCSICYEPLSHPTVLECSHIFCGECISEWLDRELSCPLCRAALASSNPIPIKYRDGRTSILPLIW